jgi:hypothetical protein
MYRTMPSRRDGAVDSVPLFSNSTVKYARLNVVLPEIFATDGTGFDDGKPVTVIGDTPSGAQTIPAAAALVQV